MNDEKQPTVASPIEPVVSWIECDDWSKLPVGDWLVKINKDRKPYHVASVTKSDNNSSKIIVVGNHFSWDMGAVIAYADFNKFESC